MWPLEWGPSGEVANFRHSRLQPAVRDEIRKVRVDHVREIFVCFPFVPFFTIAERKRGLAHVDRHRQL
jgi:hypothetical protein